MALQKNRYWDAGAEGILLVAGPFVAALQYAAAGVGCRTILVCAGGGETDARSSEARPDRVVRSIADLLPDLTTG